MIKRIFCFLVATSLYAYAECDVDQHFCAYRSLLYWQAHADSIVLTNKPSPVFFTDNFTKSHVIHPTFEWDFGYRLGFGYSFPCQDWDLNLDWTHYETSIHQHRSVSSANGLEGMFPIWALSDDIIAGDYITDARLHWKINLNLVDIELGNSFSFFNYCDLRPYIGLRAAFVRQHASIHYRGGIFLLSILGEGISLEGTDHIHMKNDFWGVGPRIGIEPEYALGNGFSLYGDAAISGLIGVFSVKQKETYLGAERFSRHHHLTRFRWIGDLSAGVAWNICLFERYLLGLQLGWEYHIFFDQLELKRDKFGLVSGDRDLSVQGLTLTGKFDF